MSKFKKILGGKAQAFSGEWDDDGYTIIKVLTGTKTLGMEECEYVTQCVNEHEVLKEQVQELLEDMKDIRETCLQMARAGREAGTDAHYIYYQVEEKIAKHTTKEGE